MDSRPPAPRRRTARRCRRAAAPALSIAVSAWESCQSLPRASVSLRPRLRGDGSRIGADDTLEIVLAGAIKRRDQCILDLGNEAEAAEHQPGIDLDQTCTGAHFRQRR